VKESELVEKQAKKAAHARSHAHIGTLESPFHILDRLLGRSLKNYSAPELFAKLKGDEDTLSVTQLQALLSTVVPEALFGNTALEEFSKEFDAGNGDGTSSRRKVIDHVKTVLGGYHASKSLHTFSLALPSTGGDDSMDTYDTMDTEDSPMNALASDADARDMFTVSRGSVALRQFISGEDEEKVTGRLSRWAVMYCGGSVPVSETLKTVCADFDIKYNQEKFDW